MAWRQFIGVAGRERKFIGESFETQQRELIPESRSIFNYKTLKEDSLKFQKYIVLLGSISYSEKKPNYKVLQSLENSSIFYRFWCVLIHLELFNPVLKLSVKKYFTERTEKNVNFLSLVLNFLIKIIWALTWKKRRFHNFSVRSTLAHHWKKWGIFQHFPYSESQFCWINIDTFYRPKLSPLENKKASNWMNMKYKKIW